MKLSYTEVLHVHPGYPFTTITGATWHLKYIMHPVLLRKKWAEKPAGLYGEKPLSGYARLIRGERSAPNGVCLTPTLPGNRALWRRMKRWRAHIFHSLRIPEALGDGTHPPFLSPPALPFPLLSPLAMSCIITSRFKDGRRWQRQSEWVWS